MNYAGELPLLRTDVETKFLPDDIELLSKKQQQNISDWCAPQEDVNLLVAMDLHESLKNKFRQ